MNTYILIRSNVDHDGSEIARWEGINGELSHQEIYEALFMFEDTEIAKKGAESIINNYAFHKNDKSGTSYILIMREA